MTDPELLARFVRIREALEDGDLALVGKCLAALEADLRPSRAECPVCGLDCGWPGLRDEHVRLRHPDVWEATVAA